MVFPFRDDLYDRPDFAVMGTQIPERLRRFRPPYADNPPIIIPADPNNPFGDPPRFHDVDPPERNPYNDPDYVPWPDRSPFIVTENPSEQAGDDLGGGGLPGRLRRFAQQHGIDFGSTPSGASENNPDSYSPQGSLLGKLSALQAVQRQYRPVAGNGGQTTFGPQNPNFAQTPPARIAVRPPIAYSPYDPEAYVGEGGGLPGRLRRFARQHGIDFD